METTISFGLYAEPCQGRQAVNAAAAHTARDDRAAEIASDVHYGLQQFSDTFLDALAGDFLAEADERRLRSKYAAQPAALQLLLARNGRILAAQRALHSLYNKLLAGAAMSIEEKALAEHARDLCEGYAQGEIERRCTAAGL